jgi:hypothetical protein
MARHDYLKEALDNTTESWKRGLLLAAQHSATRERWIVRIALATLAVSVLGVIIAAVLR